MLALAGMNVAGVAVFASIYAAAGARLLNQAAFLASLMVFSVAVTAVWVRVERSRGRLRDPLSRLGRIAGALVLTLIAVPGLVLMPLFVLKEGLPAEARLDDAIRPAMVLLLVSLVLVTLTNVAGICFIAGAGFVARLRRNRPPLR
jgi:hypothetical protein